MPVAWGWGDPMAPLAHPQPPWRVHVAPGHSNVKAHGEPLPSDASYKGVRVVGLEPIACMQHKIVQTTLVGATPGVSAGTGGVSRSPWEVPVLEMDMPRL